MKKLIIVFILTLLGSTSICLADYQDGRYNYENSKYNYENSPHNYENSRYNWDNSEYNVSRKSIRTDDGNSSGYVVDKEDGGSNYFSIDGKRIGYTSPKEEYEPQDEE